VLILKKKNRELIHADICTSVSYLTFIAETRNNIKCCSIL